MTVGSKTCPCCISYECVQFQLDIREINNRCGSPRRCRIWSIQVGVLQRTAKKCTNNYNARAKPLFCSLNLLFSDVLVAVAIVFCVRYTVSHDESYPSRYFLRMGATSLIHNFASFPQQRQMTARQMPSAFENYSYSAILDLPFFKDKRSASEASTGETTPTLVKIKLSSSQISFDCRKISKE